MNDLHTNVLYMVGSATKFDFKPDLKPDPQTIFIHISEDIKQEKGKLQYNSNITLAYYYFNDCLHNESIIKNQSLRSITF